MYTTRGRQKMWAWFYIQTGSLYELHYISDTALTSIIYSFMRLTLFMLTYNTLKNFLDVKQRHSETTTPPPSPTHPSSLQNFSHQLSAASFRTDLKSLKKELILTVQHLFTWAPITQIPVGLITCIFEFTNVCSYAQVGKCFKCIN